MMRTADPSGTGYSHRDYAHALAEFGKPRHLENSDGWILVAPIGGSSLQDARGCYPLFSCRHWPALGDDLDKTGDDLVSLLLVTDPFGGYDPEALRLWFPDLCRPYKEHFVVDLSVPLAQRMSRTHARYAKKATAVVSVERCADPADHLQEWIDLYAGLTSRHAITGIAAFSEASFRQQFTVPGMVAFRAVQAGTTVGMVLFYIGDGTAYYHLAAYSKTGYDVRASYAIFAYSLEYLADYVRWVNLGAGAGVRWDEGDGLSRFKRGWATGTRVAHICGRVFDRERYAELVAARRPQRYDYFPLYRAPEHCERKVAP